MSWQTYRSKVCAMIVSAVRSVGSLWLSLSLPLWPYLYFPARASRCRHSTPTERVQETPVSVKLTTDRVIWQPSRWLFHILARATQLHTWVIVCTLAYT